MRKPRKLNKAFVDHMWKKGQSGNPKGMTPNEHTMTALLRKEIEKICPEDKEKRTWRELIILATMKLAMKGNSTALSEVWERLDGKVAQPIGVSVLNQTQDCVQSLQSILSMPITINGMSELKMIEQVIKMQTNHKEKNAKGNAKNPAGKNH